MPRLCDNIGNRAATASVPRSSSSARPCHTSALTPRHVDAGSTPSHKSNGLAATQPAHIDSLCRRDCYHNNTYSDNHTSRGMCVASNSQAAHIRSAIGNGVIIAASRSARKGQHILAVYDSYHLCVAKPNVTTHAVRSAANRGRLRRRRQLWGC